MNPQRSALDAVLAGAVAGLTGNWLDAPAADDGEDDQGIDEDANEKNVGEVYDDRNLLVLAVARAVGSQHGFERVGYYEHDEWAVVVVELADRGPLYKDGDPPKKPVSWHVRPEIIPEWLPERDPKTWFDGHDRDLKNDRLAEEVYAMGEVGRWWA